MEPCYIFSPQIQHNPRHRRPVLFVDNLVDTNSSRFTSKIATMTAVAYWISLEKCNFVRPMQRGSSSFYRQRTLWHFSCTSVSCRDQNDASVVYLMPSCSPHWLLSILPYAQDISNFVRNTGICVPFSYIHPFVMQSTKYHVAVGLVPNIMSCMETTKWKEAFGIIMFIPIYM